MNQTDLIQRIIAAEHQAQAITGEAREQYENMDKSINAEIEALRQTYGTNAEQYLREFEASEREKSAQRLKELDAHLAEKLEEMESSYAANKDLWAEMVFERIIGKAGG